jgi:hypothetical protein
MADSGLRVALVSYAASSSSAVISKDELRASADPEVTAHPSNWAVVDNAITPGRYALHQIRG